MVITISNQSKGSKWNQRNLGQRKLGLHVERIGEDVKLDVDESVEDSALSAEENLQGTGEYVRKVFFEPQR